MRIHFLDKLNKLNKLNKKTLGSALVMVLLLLASYFDILSYPEFMLQDMAYQKPGLTSPDIVVFGIDVKSMDKFGRFQDWDRQLMADAINILNSGDEDYRPAVIAIDVLYISEGNNGESDHNLAEAARKGGNVVVASQAVFGFDMSLKKVVMDYEVPYRELASSSVYGFANGIADSDGIYRSAPLRYWYEGEPIYSFPIEIYRKYTGGDLPEYMNDNNSAYIAYSGLPDDYYGTFGLGMSFSDIFDEDFDPEFYADCIVLIGPYATGMMDAYFTPISRDTQMYGVEIHANIIQMLLEGNFKIYTPRLLDLLIIIFLSLAVIVLDKLSGDIRITLIAVITSCAAYFGIAMLSYGKGYIMPLLYPLLALVVLYIYELIYGYVLESLEKQRVKNAFKKYVDPKLVDKLMESGEANSNEVGVRKDIAVLFVDVRGFTPMSEALKEQPDMVVKILNEYLDLTSSSVFNNGGSVDKFIGDATMALFNGFVPLEDYEYLSVKAAWDIVLGASELNTSIKEKYGVDVGFGVGVNCGEAIVGNLGPSFRKDYTAIGDTVNTAARLESNAKRSQVLISKALYERVRDRVEADFIGEIPLKGKSEKQEIFSVVGIKG